MKKLSIIPIVCLCSGAAFGDIASTEYVNSEKSKLETTLSTKMNKGGYTASRAMQTSNTGSATSGQISGSMMADGAITTDKLANGSVDNNAIADGAIGLKKLSLTFPTSGKHILTWDNTSQSYKFEAIKLADLPGLQCSAGTYDIGFSQCIDPATNGTDYGYIIDSVHASAPESYNESAYGLTQDNTWGVTFSYGIIKGEALCSRTNGTYDKPGNPDEAFDEYTSQYCWCRMTSPAVSRWVFRYSDDDAISCANNCAIYCGYRVQNGSDFRSDVFAGVGN